MIGFPWNSGTFEAGRYFATGSVIATSLRSTMSARISAVSTLVIEPISNSVDASGGRLPGPLPNP